MIWTIVIALLLFQTINATIELLFEPEVWAGAGSAFRAMWRLVTFPIRVLLSIERRRQSIERQANQRVNRVINRLLTLVLKAFRVFRKRTAVHDSIQMQ